MNKMIRSLDKKFDKINGANKYNINCLSIEKNLNTIDIKKIVKNKNDISILEALINTLSHKNILNNNSKHRNIVIKISPINKTLEKEYSIGNDLEKAKIPVFIKYMCLFNCFDNTYYNIKEDIQKPLCSAPNTDENKKIVLIMPYIVDGSIKNFNWMHKLNVLKTILLQSIMSLFIAYHKLGFLHNDIHLDNILIKKTKKEYIEYEYTTTDTNMNKLKIPTNGYKIVILDFDTSIINLDKTHAIEFYWSNLENMLSRVNTDLRTKNGDIINMNELAKDILSFISLQKLNKSDYFETLKLLDIINTSTIRIIPNPFNTLKYNPNIF